MNNRLTLDAFEFNYVKAFVRTARQNHLFHEHIFFNKILKNLQTILKIKKSQRSVHWPNKQPQAKIIVRAVQVSLSAASKQKVRKKWEKYYNADNEALNHLLTLKNILVSTNTLLNSLVTKISSQSEPSVYK